MAEQNKLSKDYKNDFSIKMNLTFLRESKPVSAIF